MSQTTKDYQYDRNDNNTFGVRGVASGGGTEVVANPEGTATTDLTKLKVDDTIYGIPEGTEVVANPTLAGTEAALTGLQVGDTKYAVPTPHTINTYTAGTLSEADQAKIAEDIANGYPIIVGQALYTYWGGTSEAYFVCFSAPPTNNDFAINTITYNKTSHQLSLTTGKQNRPINTEVLNYSDISGALLTKLSLGGQDRVFGAMSIHVQTTAPTANNTDGGIRIVVLSSEPATRYNGYLYIITA